MTKMRRLLAVAGLLGAVAIISTSLEGQQTKKTGTGTTPQATPAKQVSQLADPNFPRRPSQRVAGAYELVAHENYIVYFDQSENDCLVTVRAAVHVARQFPLIGRRDVG